MFMIKQQTLIHLASKLNLINTKQDEQKHYFNNLQTAKLTKLVSE